MHSCCSASTGLLAQPVMALLSSFPLHQARGERAWLMVSSAAVTGVMVYSAMAADPATFG